MAATKVRARNLRSGMRINIEGKTGPVLGATAIGYADVLITWSFRGVQFSKRVPGGRAIETYPAA